MSVEVREKIKTPDNPELTQLEVINKDPEKKREFTSRFMRAIEEGNISAKDLFDTEINKRQEVWDKSVIALLKKIKSTIFGNKSIDYWDEYDENGWVKYFQRQREREKDRERLITNLKDWNLTADVEEEF